MQCMSLFSVDYTHTHLSSCCEIGDCDIKVVQKQQADPVDIIFPNSTQPRGAKQREQIQVILQRFNTVRNIPNDLLKTLLDSLLTAYIEI